MAENCENSCGNFNTGLSQCAYKIPPIAGFIFIKKFNADGVRNGIDATAPLTEVIYTAKINEPDPADRWYPVFRTNGYAVNAITPTNTDPATFTTTYGTTIDLLPRGVVNWSFNALYTNPSWTEKVRRLISCGDWTAILVDLNNKPHGLVSDDGATIYGYDIESFRAVFEWGNASDTPPSSLISFAQSITNDPLKAVYHSDVTANLSQGKGLVDVNGTLGTPGATTITVTLTSDTYESQGAPFVGLVTADFDVINNADGTNITIASVNETSDGVYLITTTGSTGLSAHIEIAKNGFDFANVENQNFTYA